MILHFFHHEKNDEEAYETDVTLDNNTQFDKEQNKVVHLLTLPQAASDDSFAI